jgi:hypothetical protein
MAPKVGMIWFGIGAVMAVLIPWLISRRYVWFTRLLALLVLVRVVGVLRVIVTPTIPMVPLPGGFEVPMRVGALLFFLVSLGTGYMLARAAWDLWP